MSSDEDFISQVCDAFKKAVERGSGVTLEGREREFRRALTDHLFDKVLGWNGHSKVGEIYDIACFDDEDFPIIITETKWNVELTSEIKEKLRKRIEELGSVKYGVFASEREFVVYAYEDYELRDIAKVNVAVTVGVAKGEYGLSNIERKNVQKLEALKRERLVWIEDPEYFERTYKELSTAKAEGVKLLTQNLKDVVKNIASCIMIFFDSYWKRTDYTGKFLQKTFNDWLKFSVKEDKFLDGDDKERQNIIEVFCRETSYVLVGRILFIRICEDKDILEPSLSGKGLADFLRFYKKRKMENVYLRAFYDSREEIKRYYSHLHELGFFDWWWISPDKRGLLPYDERKVQDRLEENLNYQIKRCLRRLNRFDFSQVDRDILGDVYQGYLPPDERKRLGEFYTPKEVIEYILDAVGYKPEEEIRGKKILDPACGSGSFLVEATKRLIERYRRKGFNFKDPDGVKQIIDGCINSIYGLDIHPFACFIAEMNLLFQLVELYDVVRQKDKYYELPRLDIFRTDSLAISGESIELTKFLDNSRRVMFVEETRGANKVKSVKFDYVVGNPPYVRTRRLSDEDNRRIRETYFTPTGAYDIYIAFMERGIEWLKKHGKFGFITSNKYFVADYGVLLRPFILNNCDILQLVDLSFCPDVFKKQFIYPAITVLQRITDDIIDEETVVNKPDHMVMISIVMKNNLSLLEELKLKLAKSIKVYTNDIIIREIPQKRFLEIPKYKFEVYAFGYDDIISKIKAGKKDMTEVCRIRGGFMGFEYHKAGSCMTDELPTYVREYMKIISPSHVLPYEIMWKKPTKLFGKTFHHPFIIYDSTKISDSTWEFFKQKKIVARGVARELTSAYDDEGHALLVNIYGIIPSNEGLSVEYLLGLLNSSMFDFYHKVHFFLARIPEGSLRYPKSFYDTLPIKLPQTQEEKMVTDQIYKNASKIIQLKRQLRLEKTEGFPNPYLNSAWGFDKLSNIAKVHLSKSSYKISEKTIRTYQFKELEHPFREVFRIILATKEHIDFYSEEAASYVLEVLKTLNRITKRELLELKIPQQPHLKNLMNQYRKGKEQIVKNEKAVKELEKQIDDLVYKLYDVTYKERRIIEEYLAEF